MNQITKNILKEKDYPTTKLGLFCYLRDVMPFLLEEKFDYLVPFNSLSWAEINSRLFNNPTKNV